MFSSTQPLATSDVKVILLDFHFNLNRHTWLGTVILDGTDGGATKMPGLCPSPLQAHSAVETLEVALSSHGPHPARHGAGWEIEGGALHQKQVST